MRNGRGLRALIAEDEEPRRELLRRVLDEAGVEVVDETSADADGEARIRNEDPDVAVLDLGRAGPEGLDVVRRLASAGEMASRPIIVIVAALTGFAQVAGAQDGDWLADALRNGSSVEIVDDGGGERRSAGGASGHLRDPSAHGRGGPEATGYVERLLIKEDDCITFLAVRDIDWVESDGNYVRIHAANGKKEYLERRTLRELEHQLDPRRFLRIHRSTLVHLDRVEKLVPWFSGGYVVHLRSGEELKLSRGYAARLFERVGTSL